MNDSDDEFPDIAQLLKHSKAIAAKKTNGSGAGKGLGRAAKASDLELIVHEETNSPREGGEKKLGDSTSRPRKRVLNRTNANPLLLPIAGTLPKTVTSKVSRTLSVTEAKQPKSKTPRKVLALNRSLPGLGASKPVAQQEEDSSGVFRARKGRKHALPNKPMAIERDSDLEEEATKLDDSEDLSDFVVNDDSCLEEEDSVVEARVPRSTRKLVRGRKLTVIKNANDEGLDLQLQKLTIKDDGRHGSSKANSDENPFESVAESVGPKQILRDSPWKSTMHPGKQDAAKQTSTNITRESSPDLDDPFTLRL